MAWSGPQPQEQSAEPAAYLTIPSPTSDRPPGWSPGVCRALSGTVLQLRIESADMERATLVMGGVDHELEQAGSA